MIQKGLAYATVPRDEPALADEADLVTAEWEVEATPGGELVTLYGTVQEVVAQLRELNPHWDTDFPEVDEPEDDASTFEDSVEGDDNSTLVKRTDFSGSSYTCKGPNKANANTSRIRDGISYLRRVSGRPKIGKNVCSRVSCSGNSGIRWCNRVS